MTSKKQRPSLGDAVRPGDSERDLAIKLGMSRRQIWQAKKIAGIPEDQFEALVEGDKPPTVSALLDVAHHRAGSPSKMSNVVDFPSQFSDETLDDRQDRDRLESVGNGDGTYNLYLVLGQGADYHQVATIPSLAALDLFWRYVNFIPGGRP